MDYSVEHIYVAIALVDGTIAVYVYAVRLVLYKISLFVRYTNLRDGWRDQRIINKNK